MKRRTKADKTVTLIVGNEHAQGLRAREGRQLRGSSILSMSCPGARESCCFLLERACGFPAGAKGLDPLGGDWARAIAFSTFLRSRVSECLVTSYLAEVKLFFFPCLSCTFGFGFGFAFAIACPCPVCLGGAMSAGVGAQLSVYSAEPDNLLIIEPSSEQHEKLGKLWSQKTVASPQSKRF